MLAQSLAYGLTILYSRLLIHERRKATALKNGHRILLNLPLGNPALITGLSIPLVTKPARRMTVLGITNYHLLVTVSSYKSIRTTPHLKGLDAMEDSSSRWPELDLFHQLEKRDPLGIIDLSLH